MYLYHIHPRSILPTGRIYPPDVDDIYAVAKLKRELRERYHARLMARVFDGYGRWTFDVTGWFEESLRLPDYSGPDIARPRPESRPSGLPRQLMMQRFAGFLMSYLTLLAPVTRATGGDRSKRVSTFERNAERLGVLVSYVPTAIDRR